MNFRLKTILGVALIEALLLAILLIYGLKLIHDLGAEELEKRAATASSLAIAMTRDGILAVDIAALQSFANITSRTPGVTYTRVMINDKLVASAGDADILARPFRRDLRFDDVNDGVFDTDAPVEVDGIRYGRIELGIATDTVHEMLALAKERGTLIAVTEMLLVATFSFLLGTFLTRQLNALEAGAEKIAAGDYGHQIPIRGRDELAQTAIAFNTMSTQIARAYGNLRDNELRHKAILDTAVDGIITIDSKGRIETANPAAERIFGYRVEELAGRNVSTLMPEPDRSRHDSYLEAHLTTGRKAIIGIGREVLGLRKDGSIFPMELAVGEMPLGDTIMFNGVVRDISERKMSEQQLRETLTLHGAILESALDCIIGMDHEGRIREFNPAAERTFGYTREEVIGQDLAEKIIPPAMREAHRKGMARYLVDRHGPVLGKRIEITAMRAGGSEFPCELAISPLSIGDMPYFTAYLRDISDRKTAQESLQRFSTELEAIFKLSPDGFVAFDRNGINTYANPSFLAMLELNLIELDGMSLHGFDKLIAGLCDPGHPYLGIEQRKDMEGDTLVLIRPAHKVLQRSVRTLLTPQGEQLGLVVYFRDITHETEVDRMKSEFLSTAAHELRTPMASIHGFSELLIHREYDAATRKDLLETIHRQSSALVHMVNELLDLARIEARAGKDFHILEQDLLPIVRDTVAAFNPPGKLHTLRADLPETLPPVPVDRDKFAQAFLNILSNACKYSPKGGEIRIEALQRQRGGSEQVGVRVTDPGIGMTAEQLSRVCERFYRADTSGAIPGTGLGMSLVKEIMDIFQGDVEIESAPGKGSSVSLWIPVHVPDQAPSPDRGEQA